MGGKTSTVNFTSEEVEKFQKQKQQLPLKKHSHPIITATSQSQPQPPLRPRTSANGLLETSFDNDRLIVPASEPVEPKGGESSLKPVPSSSMMSNLAKSTPSLFNRSQQHQHQPTTVKPCDSKRKAGGGNWRKNSLESLRAAQGSESEVSPVSRGTAAGGQQPPPSLPVHTSHHSHSNSDSGLSSLSGRTSTMSPISTMSTVSSVSSGSSSSRASLRSASIVSSCTIPLDEEEEIRSSGSSPSGTIQTKIRQHYRGHRNNNGTNNPVISFVVKKFSEETCAELLLGQLIQRLPVVKKQGSLGMITRCHF